MAYSEFHVVWRVKLREIVDTFKNYRSRTARQIADIVAVLATEQGNTVEAVWRALPLIGKLIQLSQLTESPIYAVFFEEWEKQVDAEIKKRETQ